MDSWQAEARNQIKGALRGVEFDAYRFRLSEEEINDRADDLLTRLEPIFRRQIAREIGRVPQAPQTLCSEEGYLAARNRIRKVIAKGN